MWASAPTNCDFIELCRWSSTPTDCAFIELRRRVRFPYHTEKILCNFFALRRKITDYFLRSLKKTASPLIGKGRKFYIAESNAALIVLAGTISTSDLIFEFRFL